MATNKAQHVQDMDASCQEPNLKRQKFKNREVEIGSTTYQVDSNTNKLIPLLDNGELGPPLGHYDPETDQYVIDQQSYGGEWVDEVVSGKVPLQYDIPDETKDVVTSEICDKLQRGEVVVIEKFIEDEFKVDEIRSELLQIYQERQSPMQTENHGQGGNVRNDHIAFFKTRWDDGYEGPNLIPSEELGDFYAQMEHIAYRINEINGNKQLLTPPLGMASVYDANDAKYVEHLDNDLLPSKKWRNYRVFTVIIYLNPPDWKESDGGMLKAKVGESETMVLPKGGTLIMFDSRTVLHEVTPASRQRFAMTMWFVASDPTRFRFSEKNEEKSIDDAEK